MSVSLYFICMHGYMYVRIYIYIYVFMRMCVVYVKKGFKNTRKLFIEQAFSEKSLPKPPHPPSYHSK